jgi:hypothetical protein
MTITNTGRDPDRLLDVRADFPRVTLHGTQTRYSTNPNLVCGWLGLSAV